MQTLWVVVVVFLDIPNSENAAAAAAAVHLDLAYFAQYS
jgi:hypothetical protein